VSDTTKVVDDIDADRLRSWLVEVLDPTIESVHVRRLPGGNSSGAVRLDLTMGDGSHRTLVLKATNAGGLVYDCDASREGRILDAAGRAGAAVPAIAAIDRTGHVLGRPSFVMEMVEGRGVPETSPASFHGDGWFRDEDDTVQRSIWWSFIDALAALHGTPLTTLEDARYGPNGILDVLAYWRRSLLDVAPEELVPRQLRIIELLATNTPPDADATPALCMGDARLGNALLDGTDVRALVDFEVAYIGNPAADIGYCLMHEYFTRLLSDRPATGIPTAEETWLRWEEASGRAVDNRDYWTAFGATILCITGSRAMFKWGVPRESIETNNIVIAEWELLAQRIADG
jgi:aminoglycoside phosphotransferase (APT) family kinase protein